MDSNGNVSKELDLICPKCGIENYNNSKFCYKCGGQLLDNISFNLNGNKNLEDKNLGTLYISKFLGSAVEIQYGTLVFTTNRILIVETAYSNSIIAIKAKMKSEKLNKELKKMTPDEIFSSSQWACQSIPYSQIEKIKIKKGINQGYVKIDTGEAMYEFILQPMTFSFSRKLGFLKELKPILGDKIKIKR